MQPLEDDVIASEEFLPDRCGLCGRKLKTLRSRKLGLGPTCWAKSREILNRGECFVYEYNVGLVCTTS